MNVYDKASNNIITIYLTILLNIFFVSFLYTKHINITVTIIPGPVTKFIVVPTSY